jgi:hypothetical protein
MVIVNFKTVNNYPVSIRIEEDSKKIFIKSPPTIPSFILVRDIYLFQNYVKKEDCVSMYNQMVGLISLMHTLDDIKLYVKSEMGNDGLVFVGEEVG